MISSSPPQAHNGAENGAGEIAQVITQIEMVLRRVAMGDLSHRIRCPFPGDHPIGALSNGVHSMIDALAEAREQVERYQHELAIRLDTVRAQQLAIRELSTPVIEVWRGVVCMPVIGVMDNARASDMTAALLDAIVRQAARVAIIDITGIDTLDTPSLGHFARMTRATRLLGARGAVSGVAPAVAHAMTQAGVSLDDVTTYRTLAEALRTSVLEAAA